MSDDALSRARTSGEEVSIRVAAEATAVPVGQVEAGDIWTFAADGRWRDWFIRCGPDGYANFLAHALSIHPRVPDAPWFCLIGTIGNDAFPIGSGCTRRFDAAGPLEVYANDALGRYGNNSGQVTLHIARGGAVSVAPPRFTEPAGLWGRIVSTYRRTRGIPLAAVLAIGVCFILAFSIPGQDLLRTAAEDTLTLPRLEGWRVLAFALGLLFLAVQIWFWSRAVIEFNYGRDRSAWRPRWLLVWAPRVLGVAPFGFVFYALFRSPDPVNPFLVALAVLGLAFFAWVVFRLEIERIRERIGWKSSRPGKKPISRYWAMGSYVLAVVAMLAAIVAPVEFGTSLGAPAVVFLGIGLIIPVMVTAVQIGSAVGVPVAAGLLSLAVLWSAWLDNHAVGRRGFGAEPMAVAERMDLEAAYEAWKAAQPRAAEGGPERPLVMVLVAAQGGASRTGYWTAEVLAKLHELSDGQFARNLFAINSVSGGSVGAVGYTAFLHDTPGATAMQPRLADFAGRDALGPILTGFLFPDLLQRFIPVSILPDRAEAIERAWESAWTASCDLEPGCTDRDLLTKPFLTLAPAEGGPWQPVMIVQGASQETGRRILTSTVAFDPDELDADDFYAITGRDVPISTAIHNGARFPWISPAGTLTRGGDSLGHIVDGGYFDAAGVETIRELRAAIDRVNGDDDVHYVFVLIGYNGLTEAAQPADANIEQTEPVVEPAIPGQAPPPPQQRHRRMMLNEAFAPLHAMLQSRAAHGAHLMRELKLVGAEHVLSEHDPFVPSPPSTQDRADYVPIMLCDEYRDGVRTLEVPMNWTLSQRARDYIHAATGFGDEPGCGCAAPTGTCTRDAIEQVVGLVGFPRTSAAGVPRPSP